MSTPDPIGGQRFNPNTPEGQIEGMGNFARGLGARRIKVAMLIAGVIILAILVVGAIF